MSIAVAPAVFDSFYSIIWYSFVVNTKGNTTAVILSDQDSNSIVLSVCLLRKIKRIKQSASLLIFARANTYLLDLDFRSGRCGQSD